jgi:hypothetical protein
MGLQKSLLESQPSQWHQMMTIVNQNLEIIQPQLNQQFKKLSLQRFLMVNILVFFIQYGGLNLSTLSLNAFPLWFATGTGCAYLFLRGYNVLPGIFLGNFFAYYLATTNFSLALGCASLLTVQALLLLWFNYRYLLNPSLIFYQLKEFIQFLLYTTILTALVSSLLLFICYPSMPPTKPLFVIGLQWWLANLNGILIFSTAMISWDAYFPQYDSIKQTSKGQLSLYILLVFSVIVFSFSSAPKAATLFALVNVLLTLIISIRLGWYGTIAAVTLSGILFNFAVFMNAPVFFNSFSFLTLIFLQLILCGETIIGLVLAIKWHKEY